MKKDKLISNISKHHNKCRLVLKHVRQVGLQLIMHKSLSSALSQVPAHQLYSTQYKNTFILKATNRWKGYNFEHRTNSKSKPQNHGKKNKKKGSCYKVSITSSYGSKGVMNGKWICSSL